MPARPHMFVGYAKVKDGRSIERHIQCDLFDKQCRRYANKLTDLYDMIEVSG
jgi:hypothetical protein